MYLVRLERKADAEFKKLPSEILRRVDSELSALENDPRPKGVKKLSGRRRSGWRIRVGDYRILYRIDDNEKHVSVYRIKHRSKAYKYF